MLEKPTQDAHHADALGQLRNPRPQCADASYDEVHVHAGVRRPVEGLDDGRVGERVELGADAGRFPGTRMRSFAVDHCQQPIEQVRGGGEEVAEVHLRRMARTGQLVE